MKSRSICMMVGALALAISNPVAARADKTADALPKEFRDLMACQKISEATARLACFDQSAARLDTATQSRQVVVADREAVKTARRGLFGFTAPVGKLLGFGGDDQEEIKQVDSKVARVGHTGDGGLRLTLEDASVWEQNDTRSFALTPKIGNAVKINRGALGSFFVSVQGQRAIKMRRVQ